MWRRRWQNLRRQVMKMQYDKMLVCRIIAIIILVVLLLILMVFPEGAPVTWFIGLPTAIILLLSKKGGAV